MLYFNEIHNKIRLYIILKYQLGIRLGKNFAWGNHHYYSIKIWSTMNEKRASSQKTECLITKNI